MIPKVTSAICLGITAYPVTIEVDDSMGLPQIAIIGLPDQSVKESKDRIRSAIVNSGFRIPSKRYTINLAPADIKKEGAIFDVAIAVGLLGKLRYVPVTYFDQYVVAGELALDGTIRSICGALSIAMSLQGSGKTLIVPEDNFFEAILQRDVPIVSAKTLRDVVSIMSALPSTKRSDTIFSEPAHEACYAVLFEDIKGHGAAKRALEVAISGHHNILFIGPPGSGKTLLAKSIPSLLPIPTQQEFLDIVRIYSVRSMNISAQCVRPFRAPHYTISPAAMIGAGNVPKPGEISLAHNGVLFLDEFPEFPRHVLETLRGPLEDKEVTVARAKHTVTYPANFMLVCAMNPCPCGHAGDAHKECRCTQDAVIKYRQKVSGPMLDRIDLHIEVPRIPHTMLKSRQPAETSKHVRARIQRAREIQYNRYKKYKLHTNAELKPQMIERFCCLDTSSEQLLDMAVNELHLSARSYHRILKIARTIADMDVQERITEEHISEAIQYRCLDREI